jgi:hypothetical protein
MGLAMTGFSNHKILIFNVMMLLTSVSLFSQSLTINVDRQSTFNLSSQISPNVNYSNITVRVLKVWNQEPPTLFATQDINCQNLNIYVEYFYPMEVAIVGDNGYIGGYQFDYTIYDGLLSTSHQETAKIDLVSNSKLNIHNLSVTYTENYYSNVHDFLTGEIYIGSYVYLDLAHATRVRFTQGLSSTQASIYMDQIFNDHRRLTERFDRLGNYTGERFSFLLSNVSYVRGHLTEGYPYRPKDQTILYSRPPEVTLITSDSIHLNQISSGIVDLLGSKGVTIESYGSVRNLYAAQEGLTNVATVSGERYFSNLRVSQEIPFTLVPDTPYVNNYSISGNKISVLDFDSPGLIFSTINEGGYLNFPAQTTLGETSGLGNFLSNTLSRAAGELGSHFYSTFTYNSSQRSVADIEKLFFHPITHIMRLKDSAGMYQTLPTLDSVRAHTLLLDESLSNEYKKYYFIVFDSDDAEDISTGFDNLHIGSNINAYDDINELVHYDSGYELSATGITDSNAYSIESLPQKLFDAEEELSVNSNSSVTVNYFVTHSSLVLTDFINNSTLKNSLDVDVSHFINRAINVSGSEVTITNTLLPSAPAGDYILSVNASLEGISFVRDINIKLIEKVSGSERLAVDYDFDEPMGIGYDGLDAEITDAETENEVLNSLVTPAKRLVETHISHLDALPLMETADFLWVQVNDNEYRFDLQLNVAEHEKYIDTFYEGLYPFNELVSTRVQLIKVTDSFEDINFTEAQIFSETETPMFVRETISDQDFVTDSYASKSKVVIGTNDELKGFLEVIPWINLQNQYRVIVSSSTLSDLELQSLNTSYLNNQDWELHDTDTVVSPWTDPDTFLSTENSFLVDVNDEFGDPNEMFVYSFSRNQSGTQADVYRHTHIVLDTATTHLPLTPGEQTDPLVTITWPFDLTADYIVPVGKTLEIKNLGEINSYSNLSSDSGVHLVVRGTLIINGENGPLVYMGPKRPGDTWGGIYIVREAVGDIRRALISRAKDGVVFYENTDNSVLLDSLIQDGEIGVHVFDSFPDIQNNSIQLNREYGLKEDKLSVTDPKYQIYKDRLPTNTITNTRYMDYYDYKKLTLGEDE